jgi:pimeloyl-ACP methyl ester carboxylesterase
VPPSIRSRRVATNGVELDALDAGDPDAPVVVLAHGFPESAWSWRHQLPALADAGFHVLAPDQRGYGRSSAPTEVDAYGIESLTADLLGLVDDAGQEQAVFVGHDWGSLITWDLARMHPDRVRAVVGVSVPYTFWPGRPTDVFRMMFGDRFFYILYFQEVGPAERELEADVRRTMATILWGASAAGFTPREPLPATGTGFLTGAPESPALPWPWLTEDDLDRYVDGFTQSGFFGPLSYYRNLDANFDLLQDLPATRLTMPSYFIAGADDVVLRMSGGAVERMRSELPGYQGETLVPHCGHWTQQETPEAFNDALLGFLRSLD